VLYRTARLHALYPEVVSAETVHALNAAGQHGSADEFRRSALTALERSAAVAQAAAAAAARGRHGASGGSSSFGGGRSSGGGGGRW
jgi:uncharacterized membrane protein YgcG